MEIQHVKGLQFIASSRGHQITIDQPAADGGFDEGMTPVEIFVSSLGACIGVYVVSFCERHQIPTEDLKIQLSWEKAPNPPVRLGSIKAQVSVPAEVSPEMLQTIHRVAESCLIHNTLMNTPDVQIEVSSR